MQAERVKFDDGVFSKNGTSLGFKEMPAKLHAGGEPIVARPAVEPKANATNGFGVHICDIEVDPDTGKTKILRYTTVQDAGKAVHPSYVEGQLQGGNRAGHRLGAERRIFLRRRGQDAQRELPRLPHADGARPAR